MADYHFVTSWEFKTSPDEVWPYAGDPARWKEFWPGLEEVRLLGGEGGGSEGSTYEFVFKSFLPYTVSLEGRVVTSDPPRRLVIATVGELEGTGVLDIESPMVGVTRTTLTWDTRSTVLWMNVSAPLMRGLYEWNHDFLMKKAGNGLSQILGAPVVHEDATGTSLIRALMPFAGIFCALWAVRRLRRRR